MHFRTSKGIKIAFSASGHGRPVVFLHPIGTRGAFWQSVIDKLGDSYRTIAIDLRGHGQSEISKHPFSLADLASDVAELIRDQNANGAVVVGCSLGGMVAQGVAVEMPGLPSGLVLTGTSCSQTPESRAMMEKRAQEALGGMQGVADATLERWFPAAFRTARPEAIALVRKWLMETDPASFSLGWLAIRDLDYSTALPGIRLPTLLVRGSEDASTPPQRMQTMAELLPNARFIAMPGAGHFAPLQQPLEFAGLLREFIDREVLPA